MRGGHEWQVAIHNGQLEGKIREEVGWPVNYSLALVEVGGNNMAGSLVDSDDVGGMLVEVDSDKAVGLLGAEKVVGPLVKMDNLNNMVVVVGLG